MTSTPRDTLIELVAHYGEPLLSSPLRTEGLLKDFCGESRREIFVLVSCLRVGVVEQLRRQGGPSVKLVCARLALKLEQNLAISGDVARWAVESWAIALGLMSEATATAIPEGSDIPARVQQLTQQQQDTTLTDPPVEELEPVVTDETDATPAAPEEPHFDVEHRHEETPVEFIAHEPAPGWEIPDWVHPPVTIVVHPDNSGQKPTLREAIRTAETNACLLLQPGLYRESLTIKKNVQIRAEGAAGEVILESLTSSVIILDDACLYLARLTLKGVGGKDKNATAAVEVKSGRLEMEDCDLTSDISTILEVKGPQSEAIIRRCHLHDGKAGGVLFHEQAVGYLEECHLYRNKLSQVVIGRGCSPVVFACKISHALMAGIYVSEGGEGLIENCDIWGNAVGGVQCRRGAHPHFRHCRISANDRYGILVAEQGQGLFENCQIFENSRMGVTLNQQSNPRFSQCHIFDNLGEGVEIAGQSQGEFLDCEISGNKNANVLVKEKSAPRFERCTIHASHQEGLQVASESEGLFEQCEIFANAFDGVLVHGAKPVFRHCVLHHGSGNGVTVRHGAECLFTDCEMTHHAGTAIMVGDKSQPRFEHCYIRDNQSNGVHVDDASAPAFHQCIIKRNQGTGFVCTLNSAPRMFEGEIGQNGSGGLAVSTQAKGWWEDVHFLHNKCDTLLASEGGRPALRQCRIEGAEGIGMHFLTHAQGMIEDVEIIGSGGPGVEIGSGANPSLKHVSILNGKGPGIVVLGLGGGTFDQCRVADNAGNDWEVAENSRIIRVGC